METDGEGGGGGEAERRERSELGRLLEAIGSSKVLEKRIPLVRQLEVEFFADDLGLILQGVSHCTLHRSILQVALKCSDLDITDHLGQFLTLGAKASSWSGKHVQRSAKCIDQSQVGEEEEHNRLREEVNSLSLSISTKLLDIAAKCIAVPGLEVAGREKGQGVAQEECVLSKADDAYPTLETMAVEVEPAPVHLAVGMSPDQEALQLLHSNPRRCTHCTSEKTKRWFWGPDGPGTLCNACGQRLLIQLSNSFHRPSKKHRPCMHCGSENTPRWLKGPDGPGTLCDSCGQKFYKGRLLHYNSRRGSSNKEDSVAGNDVAALAEALPCGVGASLDAFFDNTGSEVPCGKGAGPELADEEEELEWLSNKDAFPSVDTMAVEVEEEASAPDVPRARTKVQLRVTAMETAAADRVTAAEAGHGEESMEEQLVLVPEHPPADNPAFSLVSHGPVLKRRRKSEAQTFASIRRTAKAGRAIRAAARLAAMDN